MKCWSVSGNNKKTFQRWLDAQEINKLWHKEHVYSGPIYVEPQKSVIFSILATQCSLACVTLDASSDFP